MKTLWSKKTLVEAFPWIEWDLPVKMSKIGDARVYYACRICISNVGIKGTDIQSPPQIGHLFEVEKDCIEHVQREHPE